MKDLFPPPDPIGALGEIYEDLLESALQKAHQSGVALHHVIDEARDDVRTLGRLSEEEAAKLEQSVKRDLVDAAQYIKGDDAELKDLKGWLGFDWTLIKTDFWVRFSAAADKTMLELQKFKYQAEIAEYHTGEIVGLGTLACDQCHEKLHFHKPGHIPPCPRCDSTRFHRQKLE